MADSPAVIEGIETSLPPLMGSITYYAVIRLDGEGLVRCWHPGAQRLTQYMAEEIIGQPAALSYPADDAGHGLTERQWGILAVDHGPALVTWPPRSAASQPGPTAWAAACRR